MQMLGEPMNFSEDFGIWLITIPGGTLSVCAKKLFVENRKIDISSVILFISLY
jgi:hypothetical protein